MVSTSEKVEILMDAVNDLQVKVGRVFDDDELEALRITYAALRGFPMETVDRMFNWLRAKVESDLAVQHRELNEADRDLV